MFKQDVHILIKIQKIVQLFIFAFPLFVSETEYNLNIKAIFFFFFFRKCNHAYIIRQSDMLREITYG